MTARAQCRTCGLYRPWYRFAIHFGVVLDVCDFCRRHRDRISLPQDNRGKYDRWVRSPERFMRDEFMHIVGAVRKYSR